ncbi:site-specific integrase [Paucibacter sp. TC2R-5]|uniref:tyrosine-type recombinase/integrase n=1 Tax=Paucibacter sp. TC2R-5 TaxID=2893555 RepID=UPI0021E4B2CE|nr:tyrosine-type recombinase/integrase [Paucibacter sp. TC2R-5]MCV2361643.1 site-specific integrase [Paucibacter sp. TC2R-5]
MDDAIAALDLEALGNMLEAFFVSLLNVPSPKSTSQTRWQTAFLFVRDTCERLERNPAMAHRMADIRERIAALDRLYIGLRPLKKRFNLKPRAIPASVLLEIMEVVTPGSARNPFDQVATQWRVYSLFVLLLNQGLRRGEALTLSASTPVSQRDPKTGATRWLLIVRTNEAEDDPRLSKPSIKTADSIRQIPVTNTTAGVLLAYAENYRGKVNHDYFLSSMLGKPLSLAGVGKAFRRLSGALSTGARADLLKYTDALFVTPHALRHTCAVVRMKQLLSAGKSPEQAMAHLRSYFGWSKNSLMPLHYAKAAMDERLNETLADQFDDRLEFLKALPL